MWFMELAFTVFHSLIMVAIVSGRRRITTNDFWLMLVATTTLGAKIELPFFSETRWLARERPEDKQKNPCDVELRYS